MADPGGENRFFFSSGRRRYLIVRLLDLRKMARLDFDIVFPGTIWVDKRAMQMATIGVNLARIQCVISCLRSKTCSLIIVETLQILFVIRLS